MKETELFNPIKRYLEIQGFDVQGEVGAIDILAMKGESTVAIELKSKISLKLIYQAIERQKIVDDVYIAIPKIALKSHHSSIKFFYLLLKRLSIGLLIVDSDQVNVVIDVNDYDLLLSKKRNQKKRTKILNEFKNRENNINIGGSKGKKVTVYREKSIKIAAVIQAYGVLSPKMIKEITHIDETSSILQKNYYGWFVRIRRGLYTLSDDASTYIMEYKSLHEPSYK